MSVAQFLQATTLCAAAQDTDDGSGSVQARPLGASVPSARLGCCHLSRTSVGMHQCSQSGYLLQFQGQGWRTGDG